MEEFRLFMEKYVSINAFEWYFIKKSLKPVFFPKGSFICRQGEVCDKVIFITKGLARGFYLTMKGKEYTTTFVYGDSELTPMTRFATDYDSFIHRKPAHFTIEALEDIEGLEIDYNTKNWLFQHSLKMQQFARLTTEETFSYLVQGIVDGMEYDSQERFHLFIERHPTLIERIPQYYIASFLGITPQHLSKLKHQLKAEQA